MCFVTLAVVLLKLGVFLAYALRNHPANCVLSAASHVHFSASTNNVLWQGQQDHCVY